MQRSASQQPTGMTAFSIVWIGQVISVLASSMTTFALSIWMYQQTESATAMGLMRVFYITPYLLISPVAGVMVDRYNRKLMMMVSDLAAVVATGGVFLLMALGRLEFWHLYISALLNGLGATFQWPAYSAAITTMVPKAQLGRANGMMSLMDSGPGIIAPLMAGALLPVIGLAGILAIDVATFFFAIGALALVRIPRPVQSEEGKKARGSIMKEAAFGFRYIFERPSLLGLQLIFLVFNIFSGIGFAVFTPMVLARTDQNAITYGTVQTAGAVGGVIGGLLMSAWGGFQRRVPGILGGLMVLGFWGCLLIGLGFGLPGWIAGIMVTTLLSPFLNGSNQAIWQSKVEPDLQGRVFAARQLIAMLTTPVTPIIGGLLADFIFEPFMRNPGLPMIAFGWLVGTGPGAGMGLLMFLCGIAMTLIGFVGWFIPSIREAEDLLPDHSPQPVGAGAG